MAWEWADCTESVTGSAGQRDSTECAKEGLHRMRRTGYCSDNNNNYNHSYHHYRNYDCYYYRLVLHRGAEPGRDSRCCAAAQSR